MTVSPTASFNPTAESLIDAAWRRVKGEQMTGSDLTLARFSAQVMLQSWTNRQVNLWTVEQRQFTVVQGQYQYTLPADVIDVLDSFDRRSGLDYTLARVSRTEWQDIPLKTTQARVTQYFLDRQRDAPVMNFYPAPDNSTDVIHYYCIRRLRDINDANDTVDMPSRFIPAFVSGLAYYMGREFPAMPEEKLGRLKAEYDADWKEAAGEDADSAALIIQPDLSFYSV